MANLEQTHFFKLINNAKNLCRRLLESRKTEYEQFKLHSIDQVLKDRLIDLYCYWKNKYANIALLNLNIPNKNINIAYTFLSALMSLKDFI